MLDISRIIRYIQEEGGLIIKGPESQEITHPAITKSPFFVGEISPIEVTSRLVYPVRRQRNFDSILFPNKQIGQLTEEQGYVSFESGSYKFHTLFGDFQFAWCFPKTSLSFGTIKYNKENIRSVGKIIDTRFGIPFTEYFQEDHFLKI